MKRVSLNCALLIAAFMAVSVFAGDQDFVLVNKTGFIIDQFYCSASATDKWEEDILGVDVLQSGESVKITFSHKEEECIWDLLIVDEDGEKIFWKEIDLCETEQITLYYEDGTPTAAIEKVESEDDEAEAEDEETEEDEEEGE